MEILHRCKWSSALGVCHTACPPAFLTFACTCTYLTGDMALFAWATIDNDHSLKSFVAHNYAKMSHYLFRPVESTLAMHGGRPILFAYSIRTRQYREDSKQRGVFFSSKEILSCMHVHMNMNAYIHTISGCIQACAHPHTQ